MQWLKFKLVKALVGSILIGAAALAPPAHTQDRPYPDHPVKFILGYAPGGPTDIYARLLGTILAEKMGQPFIVENRPGAGATIGFNAVATAPPDGYTLGFGGLPLVGEIFRKNPPYDVKRDFELVGGLYSTPFFMVVNGALPVRTLREFLDYAKANPGKVNLAAGTNSGELMGKMLGAMTGIELTAIPYKGNAPALLALAANEVQVGFDQFGPIKGLVETGKLRIIAVTADKRVPQAPGVPTFVEAGYPKMTINPAATVMTRAGVPKAVLDKLNAAIRDAANSPVMIERFKADAILPFPASIAETQRQVQSEMEFWTEAAKAANYKPE